MTEQFFEVIQVVFCVYVAVRVYMAGAECVNRIIHGR